MISEPVWWAFVAGFVFGQLVLVGLLTLTTRALR